jgi:hypothetical protein
MGLLARLRKFIDARWPPQSARPVDQTALQSVTREMPPPADRADGPMASATASSTASDSTERRQVASGIVLSGSVITVGGDIVGGDKYAYAIDRAAIDKLFEPILSEVKQRVSRDKQAEAEKRIVEIREQAKSYPLNLVVVGNALAWLKDNVPELMLQLKALMRDPLLPSSIRDVAALTLGTDMG